MSVLETTTACVMENSCVLTFSDQGLTDITLGQGKKCLRQKANKKKRSKSRKENLKGNSNSDIVVLGKMEISKSGLIQTHRAL